MRGVVAVGEVAAARLRVFPELLLLPGFVLGGGAVELWEVDSCRVLDAVRLGFLVLAGEVAAASKTEDFVPGLLPRLVGVYSGVDDELFGFLFRSGSRYASLLLAGEGVPLLLFGVGGDSDPGFLQRASPPSCGSGVAEDGDFPAAYIVADIKVSPAQVERGGGGTARLSLASVVFVCWPFRDWSVIFWFFEVVCNLLVC